MEYRFKEGSKEEGEDNITVDDKKELKVKKCSKCGETKLLSEFYNDRKTKDGKYPQCKDCKNNVYVNNYDFDKTDKKCNRCGEIKPLSEFHNDKTKKDGKKTICKKCISPEKIDQNVIVKETGQTLSKIDQNKIVKETGQTLSKIDQTVVMINEKKCNRCEEIKPLSEFWNDRTKRDGKYTICKQCKSLDKKPKKDTISNHERNNEISKAIIDDLITSIEIAAKYKTEINLKYKKCNKCGEVKPLTEYWNDRSKKDGKCTICIQCKSSTRKPTIRYEIRSDEFEKKCNKCGEIKLSTEFSNDITKRDGKATICKQCKNYDKIPSELNETIKIYKCCQRMKLNLKKRSNIKGRNPKIRYKYKFHVMFLAYEIFRLIGSRIESNKEQLINKIIEIILQCNVKIEDIKRDDIYEITVINFQCDEKLLFDKLYTILNKEDLPYKKVSLWNYINHNNSYYIEFESNYQ